MAAADKAARARSATTSDSAMEVLHNIPVDLDQEAILGQLRLRKRSVSVEKIVQELLELVRPIARPKAVYQVAYVDNKMESSVRIGGVEFTSRLLRINLDKVERAFAYVATCGTELDEIAVPSSDLLKYYCLDTIKVMILRTARSYLKDYLIRTYALGRISAMSPGRLKDWPVTQQEPLFRILGDVEKLIGVRLTDTYLMQPLKSVSGIYFPTEVRFESCQLCPRAVCSWRRAPYDPSLVQKYSEKLQ